jgi:hypothetical protein
MDRSHDLLFAITGCQANDQNRFQDPFQSKLLWPAESTKTGSWIFLILPKNASAKLPSRGMTAIEGTINGCPFQGVLEPNGQKSHWLKVERKLSDYNEKSESDLTSAKTPCRT